MRIVLYISILLIILSCRKDTDLISEKIKFGGLEKSTIFDENKTD